MMITIEPEDAAHYLRAVQSGTATAASLPAARALQRATGLRWEANATRAWYEGQRRPRVEFLLPQPIYRLHRLVAEGLRGTTPLTFDLAWPPDESDAPSPAAALPADWFEQTSGG